MDKTILIVDDDRSERRLIKNILQKSLGLNTKEAENGRDALRVLNADENIVLVILDLDMPVLGGMATLDEMSKRYASLPVIILTGDSDSQSAVQAMKAGASDFLSKPVENARLDVSVRNALKISVMGREISRLKRHSQDAFLFSDLIGCEEGLSKVIKIGRKAAQCDLPVLLTGETGTGKEMFAQAIHGESRRAGHSFVALNCGAIPEKLVESTLFGHEKGAFTGAVNKAIGKFQEANGGTIFLDEIGELPLEAQVKLLRVLQQQEVEPVGAPKPVRVNVRVLSATNRDLAEEVQKGRFREDLYFRLNVLHVNLPPLRARKNDIAGLTSHFIDQFCALNQTIPKRINSDALDKLREYTWPGNVRELENVVSKAMALCEGDILGPDDFLFAQAISQDSPQSQSALINPLHADGSFKNFKEFEQEIVTLALAHHDGNITKTARVLGLAKSTLYTKLDMLSELKRA